MHARTELAPEAGPDAARRSRRPTTARAEDDGSDKPGADIAPAAPAAPEAPAGEAKA
jgi:hypothetical protein